MYRIEYSISYKFKKKKEKRGDVEACARWDIVSA